MFQGGVFRLNDSGTQKVGKRQGLGRSWSAPSACMLFFRPSLFTVLNDKVCRPKYCLGQTDLSNDKAETFAMKGPVLTLTPCNLCTHN